MDRSGDWNGDWRGKMVTPGKNSIAEGRRKVNGILKDMRG